MTDHYSFRRSSSNKTKPPKTDTISTSPSSIVSFAGPKVTSGRDGGVKPESGEEEKTKKPKLGQGETLSGLSEDGETERAKSMKKAININGGQLVDPAYREVGDGGEAGNTGNLGAEKVKRGDGGAGKREGKEEGVMGEEGVVGQEGTGNLGGGDGKGVIMGAGMKYETDVAEGGKKGKARESKL